jgi:hypothetical protein
MSARNQSGHRIHHNLFGITTTEDLTLSKNVKGKSQMNKQMNKKKAVVVFIALLTCALAGQALV